VALVGHSNGHVRVVAVCGDAAAAVGTVRTRTWRGEDGRERSRLEIVADEVGPSLRWDTAQVTKTAARG
jgi:single-strand DNA-binding protein